MGIISGIVASPEGRTGRELVDALVTHQYDEPDQRRDASLPAWVRDILILADFETHLQMEGLLGWWENRAANDLALVRFALAAVGMPDQAELLERAGHMLPPDAVSLSGAAHELCSISSFTERHPDVSAQQISGFLSLEEHLWCNNPSGADLYEVLSTHASNGLATNGP